MLLETTNVRFDFLKEYVPNAERIDSWNGTLYSANGRSIHPTYPISQAFLYLTLDPLTLAKELYEAGSDLIKYEYETYIFEVRFEHIHAGTMYLDEYSKVTAVFPEGKQEERSLDSFLWYVLDAHKLHPLVVSKVPTELLNI